MFKFCLILVIRHVESRGKAKHAGMFTVSKHWLGPTSCWQQLKMVSLVAAGDVAATCLKYMSSQRWNSQKCCKFILLVKRTPPWSHSQWVMPLEHDSIGMGKEIIFKMSLPHTCLLMLYIIRCTFRYVSYLQDARYVFYLQDAPANHQPRPVIQIQDSSAISA